MWKGNPSPLSHPDPGEEEVQNDSQEQEAGLWTFGCRKAVPDVLTFPGVGIPALSSTAPVGAN